MFIPVAGAAGELDPGCSVQAVQEAAAAECSPARSQGCLTAAIDGRLPFPFQNVHWEGRAGRERPVKRGLEQWPSGSTYHTARLTQNHQLHEAGRRPLRPLRVCTHQELRDHCFCHLTFHPAPHLTWSGTTQLQPPPSAQVRGFGKALPMHLILTISVLQSTPYLGAGNTTCREGEFVGRATTT